MGAFSELDACMQEYVAHLQADYEKHGYNRREFYYEPHRKYIHVISRDDNQRSSHSWVVIGDQGNFKHGDILKSASWRAPAKNFARGNVLCGGFKHIKWAGI
jgi:hypothetical protein